MHVQLKISIPPSPFLAVAPVKVIAPTQSNSSRNTGSFHGDIKEVTVDPGVAGGTGGGK